MQKKMKDKRVIVQEVGDGRKFANAEEQKREKKRKERVLYKRKQHRKK